MYVCLKFTCIDFWHPNFVFAPNIISSIFFLSRGLHRLLSMLVMLCLKGWPYVTASLLSFNGDFCNVTNVIVVVFPCFCFNDTWIYFQFRFSNRAVFLSVSPSPLCLLKFCIGMKCISSPPPPPPRSLVFLFYTWKFITWVAYYFIEVYTVDIVYLSVWFKWGYLFH